MNYSINKLLILTIVILKMSLFITLNGQYVLIQPVKKVKSISSDHKFVADGEPLEISLEEIVNLQSDFINNKMRNVGPNSNGVIAIPVNAIIFAELLKFKNPDTNKSLITAKLLKKLIIAAIKLKINLYTLLDSIIHVRESAVGKTYRYFCDYDPYKSHRLTTMPHLIDIKKLFKVRRHCISAILRYGPKPTLDD